MSKRIQGLVIMCIVVSMSLCPFLSVFGANGSLSGSSYVSPYMPVCLDYHTSNQLPFGENTYVVCYDNAGEYYDYYFFTGANELSSSAETDYEILGFYVSRINNGADWSLNIQSGVRIVHVRQRVTSSSAIVLSRETLGSFTTQGWSQGYYYLSLTLPHSDYSGKEIISNLSYCWGGQSGDAMLSSGVFGSITDFYQNYKIASYPDTIKQAIDAIGDNTVLLNQYYTSLNGKLNSLSSDHVALYNQNSELLSQVSELQSQLSSQSDEYQSALSNAQSEIESNAHSAAQSAADDVVNAGEDVSDIDDDMSDVNDIVDTLDGWIEDLDAFADTIDDTADEVADALDYADDFLSGFLSACPAIVIALFSFALVFLIVRKIIGR